jgi:hypothetical protein
MGIFLISLLAFFSKMWRLGIFHGSIILPQTQIETTTTTTTTTTVSGQIPQQQTEVSREHDFLVNCFSTKSITNDCQQN